MNIDLELPWPPSVNHYWRNVVIKGRSRVLLSERGRKYREEAGWIIASRNLHGRRIDGRLAVTITIFPPDRKIRDLDNWPKGILDSITHAGVWNDDSQIDDLRTVRGGVVKGGGVNVSIRGIAHEDA